MPSTSNAGPYSHLIITPDIKTPSPEPMTLLPSRLRLAASGLTIFTSRP